MSDSQYDADDMQSAIVDQSWLRTKYASVWEGPDLELIVLQNGRGSESWKWTARGWREPDDGDHCDAYGWCNAITRSQAETEALWWYLEK